MPYSRNAELPVGVRNAILSEEGKTMFRRVVNSQLERGRTETIAFASAWAALQRAGYGKNENGKWVKKSLPSASSVHVPSADWDDTDKSSKDKGLRAKMEAHNEKHGDKPGRRVTMAMLREVYDRGVGAYRTNPSSVRPSVNSEDQWAMARVNSFLADVAAGRVKEGGKHDTDLMPADNPLSTKKGEVEKAEYQGRTVDLDKPFRLPSGSSKKFGVYVRDGDKVKRVTFGDPNMEIRRDDPKARANFRSRHSCDTATDKTSARYWSCRMWESDATVSELTKRQLSDDQFSTMDEAVARSIDLGMGGEVHVHDVEGQAVFMPGATHEQYIRQIGDSAGINSDRQTGKPMFERAIRAILDAVTGKEAAMEYAEETEYEARASIMKVDDEQRMVWGWASVISEKGNPVFDTQGDYISPEVLMKAANDFMLDVRVAKAMHDGDKVGEVVHSFPLTKELGDALGVSSDNEGWIVAMKIHDDGVWAKVKSGEFSAFSIGGEAIRNAV